jgi:periplasmic divalent cation tolerance protein
VRTDDLCEVVITAPDAEWLAQFTKGLIADNLCAGSHQIETIRAIYPWRGEVYDTREARVAVRTRIALVDVIVHRVRQEHPYEVPGVVALPIIAANPDYAQWIRDETADPVLHDRSDEQHHDRHPG